MSPNGVKDAPRDYDAIIVGARIAGSVLAALLGRSGQRVLLLDKARFPSDTLSTHFFRAPALGAFDRLGILDEVSAAAPAMTVQWTYIDGHVIREPVQAEDERLQYFLCERRITLDWILQRRAQAETHVELRQGAKVTGLVRGEGGVTGVSWTEKDGSGEARARVVVGADGFYSTLAKELEPEVEAQSPVQRCMYFAYMRGIEPLEADALAEHHFLEDSLTYVFPTDGEQTLVAVSMPISEFGSFRQDPTRRLYEHLESLPLLVRRIKKAEIVGEVKGSGNIPSYQRKPYGPGWALVGDAQQVMDPWSGMGIDHGSTHAEMLATALDRYLRGEADWATSMTEYHTQARKWSEKTYRRTSTHAADLRPMTRAALQRRGLT